MVDSFSSTASATTAQATQQASAQALKLALQASETQTQALLDLLGLAVSGPDATASGSLIDQIA